jgi:hypothetical protein
MGGLPTRSDETFIDSTGIFGVECLGRGGGGTSTDEGIGKTQRNRFGFRASSQSADSSSTSLPWRCRCFPNHDAPGSLFVIYRIN